MYSYNEYLQLVDEYLQDCEYPTDTKILHSRPVKNYYEKTGKTPIDYDDKDCFEMLASRETIHKTSVSNTVNALKRFNDFLLTKDIEILDYTGSAILDPGYVIQHAVKTPYFSPKDISNIIRKAPMNKALYECLIRSAYEGVVNYQTELYGIKYDAFDPEQKTVDTGDRIVHVSDKLAAAYKALHEVEYIYMNNPRSADGTGKLPFINTNRLIRSTSESERAFGNHCSRQFTAISDIVGLPINWKILYINGFVNYLVNQIGKEEVINMFSKSRYSPGEFKQLKKFLEDYGWKTNIHNTKYTLLPYIVALQNKNN